MIVTMTTNILSDIAEFLSGLDRRDLAAKTIAAYRIDVLAFARWFPDSAGEPFCARAVTPTGLRDYKSYLRTVERRQAATITRLFAALRAFFRWARGTGLIVELPIKQVSGVPAAPRSSKALAKREVDRLVREAERHGCPRNLVTLQLLRHTGLRVGELCNLRLNDLIISERRGSLLVRSGKGDKDRTVPLNNDVRRAVTACLEVRPLADDNHLFVGQRGDPLQPRGMQLVVRKYARRAGLPDVTPHILQHSFAKHILDTGEDLATVQRLSGHGRLETSAVYTQPTARNLEQAVRRLEVEPICRVDGTP